MLLGRRRQLLLARGEPPPRLVLPCLLQPCLLLPLLLLLVLAPRRRRPLHQHRPLRLDERVDLRVGARAALLELVAVGGELNLDLPPAVVLEDLGVWGALGLRAAAAAAAAASAAAARPAAAAAAVAARRRRARVEAVRLDVAARAGAAHGRQADAVVRHRSGCGP